MGQRSKRNDVANTSSRTRRYQTVAAAAGTALAATAALAFAAPATAAGPYEPNDTYDTAWGALEAGTTYSGVHETDNDDDYFYFYLPQRTQLQVQASNPGNGGEDGACVEIYQQFHSGVDDDSSLVYVNPDPGETQSDFVTLDRGKYILGVVAHFTGAFDCEGAFAGEAYSFKLLPSGVTSTYEPFAQQCSAAQSESSAADAELQRLEAELAAAEVEVDLAKDRVTRAKAALRRAKAAGQPNKIKKKRAKLEATKETRKQSRSLVRLVDTEIAAQKDRTQQADDNERQACSVPQ